MMEHLLPALLGWICRPPLPIPSLLGALKQTQADWLALSLSPPRLAHALHVIIFLFNNQPWKGVGRKTSKYSHIHDSTRHECTAKLSQTALRGGSPDWWGLQQLTARVCRTGTLWSQASSSFLPSTNSFIHREIEDLCIEVGHGGPETASHAVGIKHHSSSESTQWKDVRRHTNLTLEAAAGETFPSLEKKTWVQADLLWFDQ